MAFFVLHAQFFLFFINSLSDIDSVFHQERGKSVPEKYLFDCNISQELCFLILYFLHPEIFISSKKILNAV